jgi:DNA-directed RNA polymerase subunit RPC12/RpoP
MKCMLCKNIFFILDMPMQLNDPDYCPYCGCEFELEIDIDLDPY